MIQNDLYTILLRLRIYKIGFTADIEKMYLQVLVHPEDISYQRILWRDAPDLEPVEYDLCTVTYGTSAAPFPATRTLQQVAHNNSTQYYQSPDLILGNGRRIPKYFDPTFSLKTWNSHCHRS